MKKYLSFFKIRFIAGLQYRASAIGGISTQFFWGIMCILMYSAFYKESKDAFPMNFHQIVNYVWLQQSLLAMINVYVYDNEIFTSITSGNIAYELCRPYDIYNMWFTKTMAVRLSKVCLRCTPILIFAILIPNPYGITLPPDILSAIFFLISLLLGFIVLISFSMLLYISVIFTMSDSGIRYLSSSILDFLSGGIIPLPFLPDKLKNIFNILPFSSISSTPFLIYSGYISKESAIPSIIIQLLWIIVFVLTGKLLMRKAMIKMCIQGG